MIADVVPYFLGQVKREIQSRYIGSVGGVLWNVAHPLLLLGIYGFVFTVIMPARLPEHMGTEFVPFLALALWPWLAFAESLQRACTAITDNSGLIQKIAMPMGTTVASRVVATFVVHGSGWLLALLALSFLGTDFHWIRAILLLPFLLILMVFALGLGMLLASMQVFIRDTMLMLTPLITIWFFCTPILYPTDIIPVEYQHFYAFNPMTAFMEIPRGIMLSTPFEWHVLHPEAILYSIVVLLVGYGVHRRVKNHYDEYL